MIGSLSRSVNEILREHQRKNTALSRFRYPLHQKLLWFAIGHQAMGGLVSAYVLLSAGLVVSEIALKRNAPLIHIGVVALVPTAERCTEVNSYLLGAQATLIGLVFPIAVGLVTLILQRNTVHSSAPDTHIYYSESMALGVGASGLAIAGILVLQLLWPLQSMASVFGELGPLTISTLILTSLHSAWLTVNIFAIWYFLKISLLFIQPQERDRLRQQFAANNLIPWHLKENLSRALLTSASDSMLPGATLESGPAVITGQPLTDRNIEVTKTFKSPRILADVCLAPLGWVARRWAARCRRDQGDQSAWLLFPQTIPGPAGTAFTLCQREGGLPLTKFESWVVNFSYRFRRPGNRPLLSDPADLFDVLTNESFEYFHNLDARAFYISLDTISNYHAFLAEAYQSQSKSGLGINFAQITNWFGSIHHQWFRRYHGLCDRSTEYLEREPGFFEALVDLPLRLLPEDGRKVSPALFVDLFGLHVYLAHSLRNWRFRQLNSGRRWQHQRPRTECLPPRIREIHEDAVIDLVGAWERQGRRVDSLFDWNRELPSADERWKRLQASVDYLRGHLVVTAKLVASEAWVEDEVAVRYYLDVLHQWPELWQHELVEAYFPQKIYLDLGLCQRPWSEVENRVRTQLDSERSLSPEAIFRASVRNSWKDIQVASAAIMCNWIISEKRGSPFSAMVAWRTIGHYQNPDIFGNARVAPLRFRDILSFIVRHHISHDAYVSMQDGFVRSLDAVSETAGDIPMREYTPTVNTSVRSIEREVTALLLATVPANDDENTSAMIEDVVTSEVTLPDGDGNLRQLRQYFQGLRQVTMTDDFSEYSGFFAAINNTRDLEVARTRLQELTEIFLAIIDRVRRERIVARPIDQTKLGRIESAVDKELLTWSDDLSAFRPFALTKADRVEKQFWTTFDSPKADLVVPEMGQLSNNLVDFIAEEVHSRAIRRVWQDLLSSELEEVRFDDLNEFVEVLGRLSSQIVEDGGTPVLVYPAHQQVLPWLDEWSWNRQAVPPSVTIEHVAREGRDANDLMMNGVRVVSVRCLRHALIFPAEILAQVRFGVNHRGGISEVEYRPDETLLSGQIRVGVRQEHVWRPGRKFQLSCVGDEDDGTY